MSTATKLLSSITDRAIAWSALAAIIGLALLLTGCATAPQRVWITIAHGPESVIQTPSLSDGIPRCTITVGQIGYQRFGDLVNACRALR